MESRFEGPYMVTRGEAILDSHAELDDAIASAKYQSTIDPRLTYRVYAVSKAIIVHKPCDV